MLILFAKLVDLLTAILGWGSFLTASLLVVALFLEGKRTVMASLCAIYAAAFLVVRFAFAEFYFQWMPVIALMLTTISTMRSNYEDKVNGKRWWNW